MADDKQKRIEPERARTDRAVGAGAILTDGTSRYWIAHEQSVLFVWLNSYPTPEGEIAIPIPWGVINGMRIVSRKDLTI